MLERILVPIDGSEVAKGILPYVTHLCTGLKAEVILLKVVDPNAIDDPWPLAVEPSMFPGKPFPPEMLLKAQAAHLNRIEEEKAVEKLNAMAYVLTASGIKVRTMAVTGPAANEIIRVAEQEG